MTEIVEALSPTNPFGIKLTPLGVRDIAMPTTPFKVWQAIREAKLAVGCG